MGGVNTYNSCLLHISTTKTSLNPALIRASLIFADIDLHKV
ncbi:MAG: hypothetical protein QXK16_04615 [Sulfolobales archaeon]